MHEAHDVCEGIGCFCLETFVDRKIIATLTVSIAIARHQALREADGRVTTSRLGIARSLPDLTAAEDFLRLVGSPA